jgi:FAD:protein FMN transferase
VRPARVSAARAQRRPPVGGDRVVQERRLRAMGSDAHLMLVEGDANALDSACERLGALERTWSRFLDDSEISRLNARSGEPVAVSAETVLLVGLAVIGWRRTGGRYDPTVLAAVRAAGYTESFERGQSAAEPARPCAGACGRIVLDEGAGTVTLPVGVGFDPGGIGKGLAADLLTADLMASGASGACVNLGGDLRVAGQAPGGAAWRVAVPGLDRPIAVTNGAVATSSRLRRAWGSMHHLIDPSTGLPADSGVRSVTVIARSAWEAEVLAKAAFLAGPSGATPLLSRHRAVGFVTDDAGVVHATP